MAPVSQAQSMGSCCPFLRQSSTNDGGLSHERIVGDMLQKGSRSYRVISCTWNTGDLVVFSVVVLDAHPEYADLRNRPLEAQAFWKHRELPQKLYESRKRRIRRLRNSRNFVDDFENERLRVVVCQSPNEGIGRHCKQEELRRTDTQSVRQCPDTYFPTLPRDDEAKRCGDMLMASKSIMTYAGIAGTSYQQTNDVSEPSNPPNSKKQLRPRIGGREIKNS